MNNNTLEDFFKTELGNYRPHLDFEEKALIDEIQLKTQFYEFNPYKFNLYYALAIFSGFVISLCCGGHYIYSTSKLLELSLMKNEKSNTIVTSTTLVNSDSIKVNNIQNKKIINKDISTSKEIVKKIKPSKFEINENKRKDVISNIQTIQPVVKDSIITPQLIQPARKKVIIMRRDTVFQIDTLKVKKR